MKSLSGMGQRTPGTKPDLRDKFCSLRECIPPEDAAAASRDVCLRLADWQIVREARTIMAYMAFRSEVDLSALFERLPNVRWVIPRVAGKSMHIHEYRADRLVRHRFGMLEPDPRLPEVGPEEIEVVLVPGVAFDRGGGRLGFGGGYYDRFLPTTPAVRVGIAHSACLADELPCGEQDQRVDWVITPEEIIRCRRPRDPNGC